MMRVIKPGERRKDFRWVQFECHECGCIFEGKLRGRGTPGKSLDKSGPGAGTPSVF